MGMKQETREEEKEKNIPERRIIRKGFLEHVTIQLRKTKTGRHNFPEIKEPSNTYLRDSLRVPKS